MGNLPMILLIQRVSTRHIISTYLLSIKWHLLMNSTQHTLITDVTDVIARILCDYHSHVKQTGNTMLESLWLAYSTSRTRTIQQTEHTCIWKLLR